MVWVVDRSHSHSPSLWLPWKTSGPCSHQSISGSHSIWVTSCVLKIGVRIWTPLSSWLMYLSWPSRLMASFFDPRICCWVTHVDSKVNWIVAWPHDTKDWMKQLQILGKVKRAPKMHTWLIYATYLWICLLWVMKEIFLLESASLRSEPPDEMASQCCRHQGTFKLNRREVIGRPETHGFSGHPHSSPNHQGTLVSSLSAFFKKQRLMQIFEIWSDLFVNQFKLPLIYPFWKSTDFSMQSRTSTQVSQSPRSQVSRHGCEGQLSQFWASSARAFAKQKKAVFRFNDKHGRPWKNMFEKGCFQTFLGHKNDPWRQENGGVFFLPSQVMAMGLVRSWSPVRYCLTVGDITGVHSKQLCNSHFSFFLTAAPALCHASPSLGMYPIVQDGTNDIWFLKSKDSSYLTPGVSSDSLLQCWFWFAGDRMQISIPHLGKNM